MHVFISICFFFLFFCGASAKSEIKSHFLNVAEAFQQAKHRMIAARENLKRDFIETLKAYESPEED